MDVTGSLPTTEKDSTIGLESESHGVFTGVHLEGGDGDNLLPNARDESIVVGVAHSVLGDHDIIVVQVVAAPNFHLVNINI